MLSLQKTDSLGPVPPPPPALPSVFLVDDEPRVRDGLRNLLQSMGYTVSGEAGTHAETLAHASLTESALVLLDLSLGAENGLGLIPPLRQRGLAVLVCSLHEGSHLVRRALSASANGYITKREVARHLPDSVGAVSNGTRYLSPRAAAALDLAP